MRLAGPRGVTGNRVDNRVRGWGLVAVQVVLIVALVMLPGRSDWPTPGWLEAVSLFVAFGGLVFAAFAAARLGTSLTPTPVPKASGQLKTGGLYKYMRHPIYTGVLAWVAGVSVRSGSWLILAVAVATFAFFNAKAKWEEERLAETYHGYKRYAARTPRFLPRLW